MEQLSNPDQGKLFEHGPPDDHFEYELLKGHNRTDGSYKTGEQLRVEYVERTDDLVYQMTHGVKVKNPETGDYEVSKPDVVIWLDKSARPVSWLTKELWSTLASEKDGEVPDMPLFNYANIDRQQWVTDVDPDGTGRMDINKVDTSIIRSLRSLFVEPGKKGDKLDSSIDQAETRLDGKTVLIVDEVRSTGRTLDIAGKFFARAFPKAKIASTYWIGGQTMVRGATGNPDLPVWYKEDEVRGRGVGNRNEVVSQNSTSRTQRLGAWFLSTRLSDRDTKADQLRREVKQLASDVRSRNTLVIPSVKRDDYYERVERLNGISLEEFITRKRQLTKSD
jgi:hypothetical protein